MDPIKDLKILAGGLLLLILFWFVSGGYERAKKENKPFLKPPAPIDTGERFGLEVYEKSLPVRKTATTSTPLPSPEQKVYIIQ